jgi:hypothetical protein
LMNHKDDTKDLYSVLENIEKFKIFDTAVARKKLLDILSLGMKNLKIKPEETLELIKKIETEYSFNKEDYLLFSDGYLSAVAKVARQSLLAGKFDELNNLIDIKYLNNNAEIISMFVSILTHIAYDDNDPNLNIETFLKLIENILNIIKINLQNNNKINENERILLHNYLLSLSKQSSFIKALIQNNLNFLGIIESVKEYIFKDPVEDSKNFMNSFNEALIRNQIELNSIEFTPTKNLHKSVLSLYKKNYQEQYLDYTVKVISEFNKKKPNEIIENQLIFFKTICAEIFGGKKSKDSKKLKNSDFFPIGLIKSFLDNWYLGSNYPNSFFEIHNEIIDTLGNFYQDTENLEKMKRNVQLSKTLSVINQYQNQNEIESNLESYLKDHVQKSELFEEEYFEYLDALFKRDFSVFFDFSCALFHLNAIQKAYKGQNHEKVKQIFNLFEEKLLSFFEVEIKNSFLKTVREYLERIEKFIPSVLKNPEIYTECLENLINNLNVDLNITEVCALYVELYEKMKKFSDLTKAKDLFNSGGFDIANVLIASLNIDLISNQELNSDIIRAFFMILFENLLFDKKQKSSDSMIKSMNRSLEEILKFPIFHESVLILVRSIKDAIGKFDAQKLPSLFEKTIEILNILESEIEQRNSHIEAVKQSGNESELIEIKQSLEKKISDKKANRFDYHILVLVCKRLNNMDLARKYAIEGMNIQGIDSILEKIMRNFIKITTKKEFKKLSHLIRADLLPYIEPAFS